MFLKCLLPASTRGQGTEETFNDCLRNDDGGGGRRGRKAGLEEESVVSGEQSDCQRQEVVVERDEARWSEGAHESLVPGLSSRVCFVLHGVGSSRPGVR